MGPRPALKALGSNNAIGTVQKNLLEAALIVVYCGGVKCSAWKMGCDAVCKLGYTNVKHFPEGLSGWDKAKLDK